MMNNVTGIQWLGKYVNLYIHFIKFYILIIYFTKYINWVQTVKRHVKSLQWPVIGSGLISCKLDTIREYDQSFKN